MDYYKHLLKWARRHYWDSLEKDKDLIISHLRTFAGDEEVDRSQGLKTKLDEIQFWIKDCMPRKGYRDFKEASSKDYVIQKIQAILDR